MAKLSLDILLLVFQLIFYSASIGLSFGKPSFENVILLLIFPALAFIIKTVRQLRKKKWRQLLKSQIQFYIVYLLTGFQCVFQYQVIKIAPDQILTILTLAVIIVQNLGYSFFCNPQLSTKWEILIYSFGQITHLCLTIKSTIEAVIFFDEIQQFDLQKDFILLVTATIISEGALILDLIMRSYQKLEQEKKPSELEIELQSH